MTINHNIAPNVMMAYRSAGLCALPARRDEKRPSVGQWKQYQERLPTEAEVSAWSKNAHDALCIICGRASGNGEMIDFDAGGELFDAWSKRVPPALLDRLVIESTQHGGMHAYYRCESEISGNMKLAQRKQIVIDDEIVWDQQGNGIAKYKGKDYQVRKGPENEKYIIITLIETRGEGGLFLCAPTAGYELVQGDLCEAPVLTVAERDVLLQAARELNGYRSPDDEVCKKLQLPVEHPKSPADNSEIQDVRRISEIPNEQFGTRPGDDFNRDGDMRSVLEQFGWVCTKDGENEHWRRPGKTFGTSATLKDRVFYVFSSNAAPFEPNQGYSPFAVYALLEHGGDYEQAARSLRERGFGGDSLADNAAGADISAIVRMSAAPVPCPPHSGDCGQSPADDPDSRPAPGLVDPGPIPAEMLRVPGFVSEVMDHTLAIAPYPNPVMAFGGALALQAFLAGRKVRDSGDNRTNLYLLGLAHSGAGKDQARKVNNDILHAIGLSDGLGLHIASGEGIQDALFVNPCMLFQTDEIDSLLQAISKSKDARHEAIMSTMLTMYSSANSVFPMRRKAGKESPGVIDQPHLVIYGTAIPNHYYEALSERMLTNGFFARMIILEAGARSPGQEPKICDLPPRILAIAKWWADYRPGTGNLENWHPTPAIIEHTTEAKRLLVETRLQAESEYTKAESVNDSVGTTVWGRVSEQIRKLSLIYAVSENHQAPRIGLAAVEWASAFAVHQTRHMLAMAAEHVATGVFDAECKKVLRYLVRYRKSGPVPDWKLRRHLATSPHAFDSVVEALVKQHQILFEIVDGKTKPKTGWIAM